MKKYSIALNEILSTGVPTIRLVPFNEIKLGTERRYLVKGLIPRIGLTIIWGPPKCGKSFWIFDVAMHVALGWDYRGHRVHQGAVVYAAFEGQAGIEARAEAFRQSFLAEDHSAVPFYLEPVTLDLVRDHRALIAAIKATLVDITPVLLVLDTLNRSLRGSESSDEDMSAYVGAADALREAFNCAVAIVHHCGVDGTRPRGHTSLTGACEGQLSVRRDGANNVVVTVELMKDGAQGETVASKLQVVNVGFDEDDEIISSCVVMPADHGAKASRQWPGGLRLVHEAIIEAILQLGIDHRPHGDGPQVKAALVKTARDIHNRKYVSTGDGDRAEAERKAWTRNFKQARSHNLISGETTSGGELVWITS